VVALLAVLVLAAIFSPAALGAESKCAKLKEQSGCVIKSGSYQGTTKYGSAPTYAVMLSIGDSGGSSLRGVVRRAACSGGGDSRPSSQDLGLIEPPHLPKKLKVGKTYERTKHIDRVEDTGQIKVRLILTESFTVKLVSGKRAKVSMSIDQSTQNVDPPDEDSPYRCKGSGSETLKRKY
jgi:hypothetical protein